MEDAMKRSEYNKHFSELLSALRNALAQHEDAYSFSVNGKYYQTIKQTLDSLQRQEDQLAGFINRKQKQINQMAAGYIKERMQEQLDRIAIYSHQHFRDLINKHLWLLKNIGLRQFTRFKGNDFNSPLN